jgi:hypothetical protein
VEGRLTVAAPTAAGDSAPGAGAPPRLDGPLAAALAGHRAAFNDRFRRARTTSDRLDPAAFERHLVVVVDPIVRAVAAVFPERLDGVVAALFDLSLELFGQSLLGDSARHPAVLEAWTRLLPAVPRLLAFETRRVAASVTNAAYKLGGVAGARPRAWIEAMREVGPSCGSVAAFLACGQVAAWQAGMPHYREAALGEVAALPPPLAALVLGLAPDTAEARLEACLERLRQDRWLTPAEALASPPRPAPAPAAQVGAFAGLGGPFLNPPVVGLAGGQLVAADSAASYRLVVDRFGALLLRRPAAPSLEPARGVAALDQSGTVTWDGAVARFPALANSSSQACDGQTLAVTLPDSHHVFLVARLSAAAA